jgi:putative MATE family efflux protein
MSEENSFLGTEPIQKLLLRLAVPTVAAQLINMLYNIVDRIYIGHIPGHGALALTGVGVCMPLIMIISAFAALVSSGGAPRASIFMGRRDSASAERTLGNCFSMQLLLSAVLTAALLLWNRPLLLAFGASEKTIGYAVEYMNIYALGTVLVQLTLGMNSFITAQGFAKTGMLSVAIGAVSNIVLDPIFIFGFHMGVAGAAWATVISQGISCVWVVSFLLGKKTVLKIRRENLRLRRAVILPCLALGLATFIMQSSESVIAVCFNSSLLRYGGDVAVGAMTILTSVMQFAMLPLQGLGQGAQPILSYNYGARDKKRVRGHLLSAAEGQPDLRDGAVGADSAAARRVCVHLHLGRIADVVYRPCPADLHRGAVSLRHSDGLPDGLHRAGPGQGVHHRGGGAEIRAADSADLPAAGAAARQQDHGGVSGGAGGGCAGGDIYRNFILQPL